MEGVGQQVGLHHRGQVELAILPRGAWLGLGLGLGLGLELGLGLGLG